MEANLFSFVALIHGNAFFIFKSLIVSNLFASIIFAVATCFDSSESSVVYLRVLVIGSVSFALDSSLSLKGLQGFNLWLVCRVAYSLLL